MIIPAYNTAAFIAETLASVFAQSFRDFEVIVINDGSPDAEALESAIRPYRDRIIYLRQSNRGPSAARNLGIRASQAEYIAFLDGDDIWLPGYLDAQIRRMETQPKPDLAYTDMAYFGNSPLNGKTKMQVVPSPNPVTFDSLLAGCPLAPSAVVVRRQSLLDAGLFDEGVFGTEGYDLVLRLARLGARIAYQTDALVRYRVRGDSFSANDARMMEDELRLLDRLALIPEMSLKARDGLRARRQKLRAALDLTEGKQCLARGQDAEAARLLGRANAHYRRKKLTLVVLALRCAPRFVGDLTRWWEKFGASVKTKSKHAANRDDRAAPLPG